MNLEQIPNSSRNAIQIALASVLYDQMRLTEDEMMNRWVNDGYAMKFHDYLLKHPEIEEKIVVNEDEDALEELKKEILLQ